MMETVKLMSSYLRWLAWQRRILMFSSWVSPWWSTKFYNNLRRRMQSFLMSNNLFHWKKLNPWYQSLKLLRFQIWKSRFQHQRKLLRDRSIIRTPTFLTLILGHQWSVFRSIQFRKRSLALTPRRSSNESWTNVSSSLMQPSSRSWRPKRPWIIEIWCKRLCR